MVQQLKQCPTCHFRFPDFQRVCAFDGAELVPYEKPQSLMKVPQPPTRRRRSLKPSMSLTSLAVLFVFLSAVLIGYLKSPNPSIPAVVVQKPDANSVSSTTRAGRTPERVAAENRVSARATRARGNLQRRLTTSSVRPEVNRAGNRVPNAPMARQREVQQTSRDKSPKVVAILKTTWKILKKPFDF